MSSSSVSSSTSDAASLDRVKSEVPRMHAHAHAHKQIRTHRHSYVRAASSTCVCTDTHTHTHTQEIAPLKETTPDDIKNFCATQA